MSSAQKNTIVRSVAPKSIFEDAGAVITSTLDCTQGDLLVFDVATTKIVLPTLETQMSTLLGIANDTLVDGQPASPYQGTAVDASQKAPRLKGPVYGVVARMIAKTGDAFTPGISVYFDPATSQRGVTVTPGTKVIGVYQGPTIAAAVAGQDVEILIGARHPGDVLQF